MKIAIIGAGFYGCYLAKHLSKKHEIYIFEKNADLISGLCNEHRVSTIQDQKKLSSKQKKGIKNFF